MNPLRSVMPGVECGAEFGFRLCARPPMVPIPSRGFPFQFPVYAPCFTLIVCSPSIFIGHIMPNAHARNARRPPPPTDQFLAAASALGRVYLVSPQGQLIHTLDCQGKVPPTPTLIPGSLPCAEGRPRAVVSVPANAFLRTAPEIRICFSSFVTIKPVRHCRANDQLSSMPIPTS